jgi:hypothetical protein
VGEPKGFLVVPIGFNPSDDLRSLELDADDNLKVAFAAAAQGLVGPHGWISGAWQKNPLLFGYSGQVARAITNLNLPAGQSTQSDSAVPAGEIWVLTHLTVNIVSAVMTNVQVRGTLGGVSTVLFEQLAPVTTKWYDRQGSWIFASGDVLQVIVFGAALNDDVVCRANGYRVDIDQ